MHKNHISSIVAAFSSIILILSITGCPPGTGNILEGLFKGSSMGGCRGCETCNPEEGEGESEIYSLMLGLGSVNPVYVHGSITANPQPSEFCEPLPGQPWCGLYPSATEVFLTPGPNPGYAFSHWTGDLDGNEVPGRVIMDADKHVTAEFTAINEGEGEPLNEGEPPLEGEGESAAEGEGEVVIEGEGEIPAEGEILPEGEGETPVEGEMVVEGEGENAFEGEGEILAEGEGENEPSIQKPSLAKYYVPFVNTATPNSPSYTLPIDANDAINCGAVKAYLDISSAESLIAQNGFAVMEYDWTQHFFEVEDNDDIISPYQFLSNASIPMFITSDTLLHLYHVQFDESLKEVEETEFIDDISGLTAALLGRAQTEYENFEGNLKEAAKRNVVFLSVAARLLDETTEVPDYANDTTEAELALISAHGGFAASPLFIYEEDYSQYLPRGHYTRSDVLKRYFKALMWYGRLAFLIKGHENWGPDGEALISPLDADIQTLQAVLLSRALEEVSVPDERTGQEVWDRMYAVTAFYVGLADDLTPIEYMQAANAVLGAGFDIGTLENEKTLFELRKTLALLRMPQIYGGTGNLVLTEPITPESLNEALAKTQGMRFTGQRFIPDSYMFQHLVFPEVLDYTGAGLPFTLGDTGGRLARCYPRGLDVMAVMGSHRAHDILVAEGDTEYVDFEKAFSALQAEFAEFDETDWHRNLYWGWLYALRTLTQPFGEGYPSFMRTDAWETKELNAALASWTELRHDTILYAKQSYTPTETSVPDPPPGYVEPVPEFFGQLLALTRMTRTGLSDMEALSEAADNRLNSLESLLETLIAIANKQLTGTELSDDDLLWLAGFAAQLEFTVLGVGEQGVKTTLAADVHTHGAEALVVEEGVGEVDLIVVACPTATGDFFLAVGPVLSYYEFKHPMNDRLTDEAWRDLLASEAAPARPPWMRGIMP